MTTGILKRMAEAPEKVYARMRLVAKVLGDAGIPYAVVGGNAVAAWVARIDAGAVRNTRDVDILLDRRDWEAARRAMEQAGFHYRHVHRVDMFLERPEGPARDGVHVVFAHERVNDQQLFSNPPTTASEEVEGVAMLNLDALVRIKLDAWRDKDRTHLRDLLEVGLLDESWLDLLPPPLAERLRHLIQNPE